MKNSYRGATLRDVLDPLEINGITEEVDCDQLVTLDREVRKSAWRRSHGRECSTLVGYETEAISIKDFQPSTVPGPLQTLDYVHACRQVGWLAGMWAHRDCLVEFSGMASGFRVVELPTGVGACGCREIGRVFLYSKVRRARPAPGGF
jgi:hypothetical protein